jgi:D-alanyl-lipoteichoic acid acyltransferase DltB (MBOAT superfamily)
LFKKIVVADTCAEAVNVIFKASPNLEGSTLALGAILFAIQIYGDFSGYSDIALGSARLLGFELLQNFSFPYFSRDIAEFWRKWHISLTSWFRDYLYVPLGGSKVGTMRRIYNTIVVFLVSGFWHGANWTFIAWGLYNAICFIPLLVTDKNRVNMGVVAQGRTFPGFKEMLQMMATFLLLCLGWIFFRANSMGQVIQYIQSIFTTELFTVPDSNYFSTIVFIIVPLMLLIEWWGRGGKYALENLQLRMNSPMRFIFYIALAACIMLFSGVEEEFIYFQF